MHRRQWLLASLTFPLAGLPATPGATDQERCQTALLRGRKFLAQLFDPRVQLLPEYSGAHSFWLYHDNYLAVKALRSSHPEVARQIEASIHRYGVTASGKIEILFGEARQPLPFRHPRLIEVKRVGECLIKTEILTNEPLQGWDGYADLLCFTACALAESNPAESQRRWRQALRMWDGHGFRDQATEHLQRYATFKLAVALITARRIDGTAELPGTLLERLFSLQAADGGWVTDYNATGVPLGKTNVETTSLALLALEEQRVVQSTGSG